MNEHLKVSDFYYDLPKELIAQDPLTDRSASRLLVLHQKSGEITHRSFCDIKEYLSKGDCLVLNNTKVIPARLSGRKTMTDAQVEVLLLKRLSEDTWETLVRPGKKLKEGAQVTFGEGLLTGEILSVLPDGNRQVRFSYEGIFEEVLDRLGEMPLPPYITHELKDRNRYQTVYAKQEGSAAAPTAGLHFTKELLAEIRKMGVNIAEITLHVGLGTFRPVKTKEIQDHHMHAEYYEIDQNAADMINLAKARGHRVIAVGTTSTRTLESAADEKGVINASSGWTDIFIYPGYSFRVINGLVTNFHLPESTLIMLVSAFTGKERVFRAYEEAIRERYRFFSFGDAMLII